MTRLTPYAAAWIAYMVCAVEIALCGLMIALGL